MVDIAAEKGVTLTVDEVKGFLKQWIRRRSLTILSWMLLPSLPAGGNGHKEGMS